MSTFNDFYNIYKSAASEQDAFEEYYNVSGRRRPSKDSQQNVNIPHTAHRQPKVRKDPRCVVLIPVYKQQPDIFEAHNLRNTFERLAALDVCLLCPESLDISAYTRLAGYDLQTLRKADVFFRSKESYSRMMESPRLYRTLQAWEYTLLI